MLDRADMILADVEERAHVEREPVHALHLVCLRADLHHQVRHAVIHGFAHHAQRVERFGRGEIRFGVGVAVKTVVHGGEQGAAPAAVSVEDGLREIGRGGFALGAGDAHQRELAFRMIVEFGSEQAQRLARIVDDEAGAIGALRQIGFRNIGGEPLLRRAVKKFRLESALADQQRAGGDLACVIREFFKRRVRTIDTRGVELPDVAMNHLSQKIML